MGSFRGINARRLFSTSEIHISDTECMKKVSVGENKVMRCSGCDDACGIRVRLDGEYCWGKQSFCLVQGLTVRVAKREGEETELRC